VIRGRGVYQITATSRASPQTKAVALSVLTCCNPSLRLSA
jgi:hypothetical protein